MSVAESASQANSSTGRGRPRWLAPAIVLGFVVLDVGLFALVLWLFFVGRMTFSPEAMAWLTFSIETAAGGTSAVVWIWWPLVAKAVLGLSVRSTLLVCGIERFIFSLAWITRVIASSHTAYSGFGAAGSIALIVGFRFVWPVACCALMVFLLRRRLRQD